LLPIDGELIFNMTRTLVWLFILALSAPAAAQIPADSVTPTTDARSGGALERLLDKHAAPNTGPVPDYSNPYYWAALPGVPGAADSLPSALQGEPRDSSADVFFIYPTTYIAYGKPIEATQAMFGNKLALLRSMEKASWNADVDDTALNRATDRQPILYQATVFNASCRIYAPRYRQANLKAFLVRKSARAQEAFDVAYSDVRRAFQFYLDHYNHGRPIIIASHSQGSLHAIRLLKEFFDGKPLAKQLVCAYVIGYQIPEDSFRSLTVCASPKATGCVVGWRSYQEGEIPSDVHSEKGGSLCVNPLDWTTDTGFVPADSNKGTLLRWNTFYPQEVGAEIEPSTHILWVRLPQDAPALVRRMKNLHILDYSLFWMNIRENVRERIKAYEARH